MKEARRLKSVEKEGFFYRQRREENIGDRLGPPVVRAHGDQGDEVACDAQDHAQGVDHQRRLYLRHVVQHVDGRVRVLPPKNTF